MSSTTSATRVAIVGLGVMGSSLAAALKLAGGWRVTGFDVDSGAVERAHAGGSIDAAATSLGEAVSGADLVVLATPVSTILQDLDRLPLCAPDGALVIDLGSTKRVICAAMDRLPGPFGAIGGHPMAGRQTAGVSGASASLYRGRPFVLVDTQRTDDRIRVLAERLVRDIGAHPVAMDADSHDRAVAMISHVPHFLSVALLNATDDMEGGPDGMPAGSAASESAVESGSGSPWQLAAGGFRAATAPAADNVRMWADIAASNADQIADALRAVAAQMHGLADVLADGDRDELQRVLAAAARLFGERMEPAMPAPATGTGSRGGAPGDEVGASGPSPSEPE